MITMTVQGADYAEIRTKLAAMFEPHVRVDLTTAAPRALAMEVETVNVGLQTMEVEPKKGRGRPPKEKPVEAALPPASTPAPEVAPTGAGASSGPATVPPGGAPAPVEATFDNMKLILQQLVAKHKTTEEGMTKVSDLIKKYGAEKIKAVAAEHYAAVIADAQQAMATV